MKISPLATFKSLKFNAPKNNANQLSFSKKHINPVNKALTDSKTGKIDKSVDRLIKYVFKLESIFASRYVVMSGRNHEDLVDFINALKNNKGEFERYNISCARRLLSLSLLPSDYGHKVDFYDIALMLNFCKKDDGVFDKELFENIFKLAKKDEFYDLASRSATSIFGCSVDEKKELMSLFMKPAFQENLNTNFYNFSRFCIDSNWQLIPENIEFIEKLSQLDKADYSRAYISIVKRYPEQREYLFELAKNPNFQTASSFNLDFISLMMDGNQQIPKKNKERFSYFLGKNLHVDYFYDLFKKCHKYENGVCIGFDDELFKSVLEFAPVFNDESYKYLRPSVLVDLLGNKLDIEQMTFRQKTNLLNDIKKLQEKMNDKLLFASYIQKISDSLESKVKPLEILPEFKIELIKEILSSKNSNFTPFEEKLVQLIPKLEVLDSGLKLKYTRQEFMSDLAKVSNGRFEQICNKLNITPTKNNSYNGLIQLHNLNLDDSTENAVYNLAYKFMYENSFDTDDNEFNEYLNVLIKAMPEFINVVDKKQHGVQDHSLDVHILLTLAYALSDPNYFEKLTSKDRAVMKFAILFHDLSKKENVVDSDHPQIGASWVKNISTKIFQTEEMQNRVYEFVKNHHWTKEFNVPDKSKVTREIAFKFRRQNDFEMAKIMARADMKAVSDEIYEAYSPCLRHPAMDDIETLIERYNKQGSVVNSHSFVSPKKLKNHIVQYKGFEFPLINLNNLDDDSRVDDFGFSYGLKKKDLRFLVHMVNTSDAIDNLRVAKMLTNPVNAGVLSQSLISFNDSKTYGGRIFGLLLSSSNYNVVAMDDVTIGSGVKKDFNKLIHLVFDDDSEVQLGDFRIKFLRNLGKNLYVKADEFGAFYKKYLSNLTSLTQIDPNKTYELGKITITGEDLILGLKRTIDGYVVNRGESSNEIITYMPKLEGVVAKVKSLDEIPMNIIEFVAQNNLPLVLI